MKKIVIVLMLFAVIGVCSNGVCSEELTPRTEVLTREINEIQQTIARGKQMIIEINNEISELQAQGFRKVGALEELNRVKEILQKNEDLKNLAKAVATDDASKEVVVKE